jgi:hypothetical protein
MVAGIAGVRGTMLRETTFVIGGGLTIALGVALLIGLYLAGAGLIYFEAWLAGGIAVGFGAFFIYVGRDETRVRRAELHALDPGAAQPPGPPSK